MAYVFRNDLWDGKKEIQLEVGENAMSYINDGYKVVLKEGTCISLDTGKVMLSR